MTAQVLFNPLAYIDRLTRGGFTPEQARASAEALETAFSESVATKADVDASKHELSTTIEGVKHELSTTIEGVKHEVDLVKRDVAELKLELKRDISESESRVRLEIAQSKNETLRWMFGFVVVLIGAIFAIVKFVR
jgi:hypothetical protein